MNDAVLISSEEEAWEVLRKAIEKEISDTVTITFQNWPVFDITIEGEDFNGTIPTRIMPPILDLQKEIHRIYCKARYGSEDTRKLTHNEKLQLELIVSIRPGCTKFTTEFFNVLNEIVKNSNMSGTQILFLLLGVSMMITSTILWKDWLAAKERAHGREVSVSLSEEETKRLALITQALTESHTLKQNQEAIDVFKSNFSRKLEPADQLKVNEQPIINGEKALEIVPLPKQEAKEIRIDGEFIINEVKFPTEFGGKYRLSVTRLSDDTNVMVDASPDALDPEELSIIRDGGFEVKRVIMQINAKQLRDTITSAHLVTICWPR